MNTTYTLVFVRSGTCVWNVQNRFPSWYDTHLSEEGKQSAWSAGLKLRNAKFQFDVAFTSVLTRAHESLHTVLDAIGQPSLPVETSWRLNDRHYGALIGQNRLELVRAYGEEQVRMWRRSYDIAPPPMRPDHPYYEAIVGNPIYADGPPRKEFPDTESLRRTVERIMPYWVDVIAPRIVAGERVLVCSHGNTLRGLVKHLDGISDHNIARLNIPRCIPFVYELDTNLVPVTPLRFLADPDVVLDATEAIEQQIMP